jgi:glycosyltransferase involved in cell wall biosynthesis
MRILAFAPSDPAGVSGNSVTLRRVQSALRALGHGFLIEPIAPGDGEPRARDAIARERPDVVHFYHALKTGRLVAAARDLPRVVSLPGTDLNHCLEDPHCSPAVMAALRAASVLVTYNRSLAGRVAKVLPEAASRLRIIPKGVVLGGEPYDLRAAAAIPPGAFVFLNPGAIRPVKNNLAAIDPLRPLAPEASLVLAGPVLDDAYGGQMAGRLAREPWVRHLPHIPHAAIPSALRACDAVLNTSLSEGISNALMESMACGRAVLASDVPGNRDLLEDGVTGLLWRGPADLGRKAAALLRDAGLRRSLGEAAARHARQAFSVEREAEALLDAYRSARA